MSYVGLRRTERVPYRGTVDYSGNTSGYGEALVEVARSNGNGGISYSREWRTVQCRNVPYSGTVPYSGHEDVEITINA